MTRGRTRMLVAQGFGLATAVAAAVAVAAWSEAPASHDTVAPGALPASMRTLLANELKLTPEQIRTVESGQPFARLLESDPAREVAVVGSIWIDATPADYVRAISDIERFERGDGFLATKRISDPPRLQDFDRLELPDEDVQDLKTCHVGDCEIKLAASAMERMRREVDWSKPTAVGDAKALARRVAFDFTSAYVRGGNDELAVYRDQDRPTFVAKEFESLIERMPALDQYVPDLRAYLLRYPRATLPDATSFLYWHQVKFGLKPTIRINHVVIQPRGDLVLIAFKQLYASHYFWTALELQGLVRDPSRPRGFWLVNVSRSRSDGLSGFVGRLIRGKVTGEAQKGLLAGLVAAKAAIEHPAR